MPAFGDVSCRTTVVDGKMLCSRSHASKVIEKTTGKRVEGQRDTRDQVNAGISGAETDPPVYEEDGSVVDWYTQIQTLVEWSKQQLVHHIIT